MDNESYLSVWFDTVVLEEEDDNYSMAAAKAVFAHLPAGKRKSRNLSSLKNFEIWEGDLLSGDPGFEPLFHLTSSGGKMPIYARERWAMSRFVGGDVPGELPLNVYAIAIGPISIEQGRALYKAIEKAKPKGYIMGGTAKLREDNSSFLILEHELSFRYRVENDVAKIFDDQCGYTELLEEYGYKIENVHQD